MNVLVTGGAGFVGRHLVAALCARGDRVLVIDDLSKGVAAALPDVARLDTMDVRDPQLSTCATSFAPHAVVHLAAQSEVARSLREPLLDASVNVVGTLNALRAAAQANASVFVFASSGGTVYGDAAQTPTPETAPLAPLSPYGASKVCGETYVALSEKTSPMRCVSLRFANIYGPGQSATGEAGVVALFLAAIARGEPLCIRGDGAQTRDFLYVEDAVEALLRAIDRPSVHGAINVAQGRGVSVTQLARRLARAASWPLRLRRVSASQAEVRHSVLDAALARRQLGWRARTSLREGLAATVLAWQQEQLPVAPRGRVAAPSRVLDAVSNV